MLTPFLRYLYCEPQRQPAHAAFRQNLLRLLLPVPAPAHEGGPAHNGGPAHEAPGRGSSLVHESLLGCFCQLVPHMQVRPPASRQEESAETNNVLPKKYDQMFSLLVSAVEHGGCTSVERSPTDVFMCCLEVEIASSMSDVQRISYFSSHRNVAAAKDKRKDLSRVINA
jgi:hypothetical protein